MNVINMNTISQLQELGFSQYEISCYLSLLAKHPSNGSQLSRLSGVSRSRIYDVLQKMARKGLVLEVENGLFVPLPADELIKRLRSQFETNLAALEKQFEVVAQESEYEYIWSIRGYAAVLNKAVTMIAAARREIYVRVFPRTGRVLEAHLQAAVRRGVGLRYISMGHTRMTFDVQVIHPHTEALPQTLGGRSFDVICDASEALTGIFEADHEDTVPITWSRNRWFVIAARDSLRHDFYHYFLDKLYDRGEPLNEREKAIYESIKADD